MSNSLKPVQKRFLQNLDYSELNSLASNIALNNEPNKPMDQLLEGWHSEFMKCLDSLPPVKSYPVRMNHSTPFLSEDIRDLLKHRDFLVRKLKSDKPNDTAWKEIKVIKKQIKSRLRSNIKAKGHTAFLAKDSKKIWKFIKPVTFTESKQKSAIMDIVKVNNYFASVVHSDRLELPLVMSCDTQECFAIERLQINQVERALKKISPDTAMGADGIPAIILQNTASAIAPHITRIFNASIDQCIFPSMWKQANITPVYKNKGSKSDPQNFRPISVLPVLARVCKKEIATQLYRFCDLHEIIPQEQFGFRHSSSCETALICALDSWIEHLDVG